MMPPRFWRVPTRKCMRARRSAIRRAGAKLSGDDVRRQLVFDEGDAVAQHQFALLQPLHLNEVGTRRILQRSNRSVEVTMLLQQAPQLRAKLAFLFLRHRKRCLDDAKCSGRTTGTPWVRSSH